MAGLQKARRQEAGFASPAWIEALSRAAAEVTVDPDLALTVDQHLTDGPAWHFLFAGGAVRVASGESDRPDIVLTCSLEIALAIHAGELSAQRAFLDGELQIGGDLTLLIEQRAALSEVTALMAAAT